MQDNQIIDRVVLSKGYPGEAQSSSSVALIDSAIDITITQQSELQLKAR